MHHKNIAVWGNGRVGRSVAQYARKHGAQITIFDVQTPHHTYDSESGIQYAPESELYHHRNHFDYIVPSPGIDINAHPELMPKCIAEYDLYAQHAPCPYIAITGSLGKTSITKLLTHTLKHVDTHAAYGGNIGFSLFSLLEKDAPYDYHVLELSSFQLEHACHAAADLAVITNIHPNHLDRHGTLDAYIDAKCNIFRYQNAAQWTLLPISLRTVFASIHPNRACAVFATSYAIYQQYRSILHPHDTVYCLDTHDIYRIDENEHIHVAQISDTHTYTENWLIVTAAHDILGMPLPYTDITFTGEPHRREYLGMYNGISCYNDSKATIMPATVAAVQHINHPKTTLIIGGLSKGVDREPDIARLAEYVTHIICFGAEAIDLQRMCKRHNIAATTCSNLAHAVTEAFQKTPCGGCIILSPGGTSFDLFASYQERGDYFTSYLAQHADHI